MVETRSMTGGYVEPLKEAVKPYCHQCKRYKPLEGSRKCTECGKVYCETCLSSYNPITEGDYWECFYCRRICTCKWNDCPTRYQNQIQPQTTEEMPMASTSSSGGNTMATSEDVGEFCRRGVMEFQSGEVFERWTGVDKDIGDWKIVWPPMVMVMNTQLKQNENGKWLGIGTQELLEYHKDYGAVEARNAFGPEGHRGMSVLLFDSSVVGYFEAERLSKHFERQGIGRDDWIHNTCPFHSSEGKRQLYGYLATEQDLEDFNQYSPGKWKLPFELASYEQKVVSHYQQLYKDSQLRKEKELNSVEEEMERLLKLGEDEMRG